MKNLRKKSISLVLIFTLLMAVFMPTMVSALSYELNDGDIINSYNVTSDVVTLYVGNISVDGTSTLKYLYTDKSVNTETLTEMRKILTSDYASLLPTTAGQVAVSNDSSVTVNDVFTDAGMVAINKYPSGTVSDTSTTILYNQTQFNSLTTASATEVSDESNAEVNNLSGWNTRKTEWETTEANKLNTDPNYTPVDFPEEYRNIFNDNTSYPTTSYFIADNKGTSSTGYIIRNGAVAQVDTYPINRTIIKVVNTSANVTMPVSATSIASTYVTLKSPRVGDKVEKITKNDGYGDYEAQSTQPTVSTTTEGLVVSAYWVKGLKELSEESFYGTFEEDTYYYALIDFEAQEGYELPATFPDGIKVNGKSPDEVFAVYGGKWNHCVAKIKATTAEEVTPTYEYIDNTANQTYTINEDDTLSFRINADYSLLENGGAVYVDGTETTEYTSKSGSTIITLNKDFVNSLLVGEHTLKVAFNNGGEATTKFTIAKAEETKTEESTSNNPKTGDNIAVWISLMVVSILGVAGTVKFVKKNK